MVYLLPAETLTSVNTVHHCSAEVLLNALGSDSIDLIVTSPPYDKLRTYKGFTWNFELIARESFRVLKRGGVLVWVVGDMTLDGCETLTSFRQALYFKDVCGFNVETMIYKKNGAPNKAKNTYLQTFEYMFVLFKDKPKTTHFIMTKATGHGGAKTTRDKNGELKKKKSHHSPMRPLDNVWVIHHQNKKGEDIATKHPGRFPYTLAERHILTWCNPGDTVLDYFGGSGTTALAARDNNRNFIIGDISDEYCTLMRSRLMLPATKRMFI